MSRNKNNALFSVFIIFIFSVLLTIYTFISDIFKNTELNVSSILIVAFFRFLHFYMFIYNSFFIFLFNVISVDAFFYLFEIILMLITWYILELCPMTYYELKIFFDDEEIENKKTTFHPIIRIIFNEWEERIMQIVGILVCINVIYIIYKNKKIRNLYKIIYFIIFCFLFINSIIKSRYNQQKYGKKRNEIIIFLVFTFSFFCVLLFLTFRIFFS